MAVWSSLAFKNIGKLSTTKSVIAFFKNAAKGKEANYVPSRNCHHRTIQIRDSTFPYFKFKDLFYFYVALGAIPVVSLVTYVNIFIGPATLAVIPEGYEPKEWEYYRHPITRFFAKYLSLGKQESYERTLHYLHVKNEARMLKDLERKVKNLIRDRGDYQSWYFAKPAAKYVRKSKEYAEDFEKRSGLISGWISKV